MDGFDSCRRDNDDYFGNSATVCAVAKVLVSVSLCRVSSRLLWCINRCVFFSNKFISILTFVLLKSIFIFHLLVAVCRRVSFSRTVGVFAVLACLCLPFFA